MLISCCSLAVGGLIGFIFGIPRSLQETSKENIENADNDKKGSSYKANTSLEQISDWLTKILLGVGLTQISNIPGGLRKIAEYFSKNLGFPKSEPPILSLIIIFLITGFFIGYIVTRIKLTEAFARSDLQIRNMISQLVIQEKELEKVMAQFKSDQTKIQEKYHLTKEDKNQVEQFINLVKRLERKGVELGVETYRILALQFIRIEEYERSVGAFLKAFELDRDSVRNLNNAAIVRSYHLKDYDGAENLFRLALAYKPDFHIAFFNMACNEVGRGDFDAAIKYLKKAIEIDREKYIPISKKDETLKPLWNLEEFKKLVGKH
jgi:tetratricopeptide (TPR) repeat protein